MYSVKKEMRIIYWMIVLLFAAFLLIPLILLFIRAIQGEQGLSLQHFQAVIIDPAFGEAVWNSMKVSGLTAVITTIIAFVLAYSVHCTKMFPPIQKIIRIGILIPMLLPTITYGFAIIYSFGKQGLLTKIFGTELFHIYGFNGLLLGYVIYTIPPAFLLINNAMMQVDKKYMIVSKLMGDGVLRSFNNTVLRPLIGTLGGAFVLSFILSFTDFGIPASLGGAYNVVATQLYQVMLGSIPNFNHGAVIAVMMLLPSVIGIFLLSYLDKFNFHNDNVSDMELLENKKRDSIFGSLSAVIIAVMLSVFAVIFIAPFVNSYPYDMSFTWRHFQSVFESSELSFVYRNSLLIAASTALLGTVVAYFSALLAARTNMKHTNVLDIISIICNTVPGMVLGLSYLLLINGSTLKGTFLIIILCNIVHYFTTPYLMAKNTVSKMNPNWEIAGGLFGDAWLKTIWKVILPNSMTTIIEMFSYYFINSMVTISGIIFLVSSQTVVLASKIKELQHFAKFNEIFVLSILIFATNLLVKLICDYVQKHKKASFAPKSKKSEGINVMKAMKQAILLLITVSLIFVSVACSNSTSASEKVVIATNGDEEAITAIENALNEAGYEGKYQLQSLGTSELGGKLMAEGKDIEADLVTMSSYFLESAQQQNDMFTDLTFDTKAIDEHPSFYSPILAITGAIFVNTEVLKENGLKMPESIMELTSPEYKDLVSIPNIADSSTGWLLVQAILTEYGEEEGKEVLEKLIANVGPHLESSGSGPIKKVQAGEVAAGFGLRHQAVKAKEDGAPIDYIDPTEGNFSLTESVAVVKKDDKEKTKLAMEMAETIISNARQELITNYPVALYEGETVDDINKPAHAKQYAEQLTVELLEEHQQLFTKSKQ
ncbi:extracellular solute-binding protein [Niallia taxi]|uniref:extracellular solute-binding protein n=1 Tax=Niallia taxi TaxID=2499688 RepID=UPI0032B7D5A3